MAAQKEEAPKVSNKTIFNTMFENPEMVLNAMTSRAGLLQSLFDPRRDIDEECGYPKVLSDEQLRRMYDREIGRRVVNVYPEETWKKFPKIFEDPDPENNTAFEEDLEALDARHHLMHYMQRADELSGVGHYGIILWGIDDGKELRTPVDGWESWEEVTGKERTGKERTGKASTDRNIIYIRVLDASLVNIATYEQSPKSPRFGLPNSYTLTLADPRNLESGATVSAPNGTEATVHWTRISHIADNRKTSEVLGTPRQEPVWNRLYDLRKILGADGEMFWCGAFPGISLETTPGMENTELDEETTREVMFNFHNSLQRYIALNGMTAKSLAPQISDPTPSFEVQVKAICVTIGVPYRVFMGIEEGVVSGDQATRAWDGRIQNRQQRYVTPMLIDLVLQRLVDYGVLSPTAEPQGWTVEWPDITVPNEKDKADVAVKKTEAFAKYITGGVDTLIPPMEFLTLVCGLDDNVAEAIIDAAKEHIEGIEDDEEIVPGRLPVPEPLEVDGTGGADVKGAGGGNVKEE